jgi:hypothetical protein
VKEANDTVQGYAVLTKKGGNKRIEIVETIVADLLFY